MKKILIILLIIFFNLPVFAQEWVKGKIVDEENKPLPSVIIKRWNAQHKLCGFATSKSDGSFDIKAEVGDTLNFSLLGLKEQNIAVKNSMKFQTIKMQNTAIELKEVSVKSERIHEHGDTVRYFVGAFANGNDRSIGDVIAKMPGFEVDKKSGKISYEGKNISKFYIDGLDMLGGKYGVATNTLPQGEVGVVEVMRNHQPIRILDDFSFSDDAAVNIKMKDNAKNHWVSSWKAGMGFADNHSNYGKGDKALWTLEGFGLRLKPTFQTMLTYKTNNTGLDLSHESKNLIDDSKDEELKDFISLTSPSAARIGRENSLFNRSHTATVNVLQKTSEYSQVNFQLIYNNMRANAWGARNTIYSRANGNKTISNTKSWWENNNDLSALIKYENNSNKSYLSNTLSGDMKWISEKLNETGTNPHLQHANVPVYSFRDNLYIISRWGKTLLTFYSYNNIQSRPQYLDVDSLIRQDFHQKYYSTNTYGMGGWKLGIISLSLKMGVKGLLRHIDASAKGLPDSLGVLNDNSHFGYAQFYAKPKIEFAKKDFTYSFTVPFESTYYKYSEDGSKSRLSISPSANIKWDLTAHLSLSLNGSYNVSPLDFNRFHSSLILQDYMTLNKGYKGYEVDKNKAIRLSIGYRNALMGTHFLASLTRNFSDTPYTMTQEFIGNYVVWGTTPMKTKRDSWMSTWFWQQAIPWSGTKLSIRGLYSHNNSKIMQDGKMVDNKSNILNTNGHLFISPYKNMTMTYDIQYSYNDMKTDYHSKASFNNWQHKLSITLPMKSIRIHVNETYYHNQIIDGKYKDMFMSNCMLTYKLKHFDLDLKVNNLFNKKEYTYSTVSNLMIMQSITALRGREFLLTMAYKP